MRMKDLKSLVATADFLVWVVANSLSWSCWSYAKWQLTALSYCNWRWRGGGGWPSPPHALLQLLSAKVAANLVSPAGPPSLAGRPSWVTSWNSSTWRWWRAKGGHNGSEPLQISAAICISCPFYIISRNSLSVSFISINFSFVLFHGKSISSSMPGICNFSAYPCEWKTPFWVLYDVRTWFCSEMCDRLYKC
jgi:hypothetical protein